MPTLNLPQEHLDALLGLLADAVPDAEAWAYGSRVNGTAHGGSDLDLVVRNPSRLDRPHEGIHRLRHALSDSNLPMLVDVLDWARIPNEFKDEIKRHHVVIRSPSLGKVK